MDTKKLRQKILDLAIRGKLVPQDPNDEPASVLLERIKAEKERLIKERKIKRSKKTAKTSDTPHYENVPFEIPENWIWITLEDILELISGQDFSPEKYNNTNSGIPYIIGASNIENEHLIINRWTEYPSVYSYLNDLLIVCKGAGIGKMAINNIGAVHIARQIQAIRAYTNYINIKYIKAVVKNNLEGIVSKANGLIPGLKRELLLSLQIPFPPFAEQQRIVTEIEHWFTLINKIEENKYDLQATIKRVKNKILDLAIHGKLVPQDPNDEPASELLKRINPKADFTCNNVHYPKVWQNTILGDIFNHNTGKALNSSNKDGIIKEYLTTSNVYWNKFDFSVIKKMPYKESELKKYTVTKGDLLVCEGGDIGRAAIWNYDFDICIQNHIHRLRPKGELCVAFYYYILLYLKENNLIGGKGIGLLGLSSNALHKIDVPLPPIEEQYRIVQKIEGLFSYLDNIQKTLEA